MWRRLVEAETGSLARPSQMPPNRLITLLEQAVAFQIENGRYRAKASGNSGALRSCPPSVQEYCWIGLKFRLTLAARLGRPVSVRPC